MMPTLEAFLSGAELHYRGLGGKPADLVAVFVSAGKRGDAAPYLCIKEKGARRPLATPIVSENEARAFYRNVTR